MSFMHVSACYDRIENTFSLNIKTALVCIFAFTNYGDKMNLSLKLDTQFRSDVRENVIKIW